MKYKLMMIFLLAFSLMFAATNIEIDGSSTNWNIDNSSSGEIKFMIASARGNTVGAIAVTPQDYNTNEGVTTVTVGAVGATYTSLITAYTASSAGDVIEIIDDAITLASGLTLAKMVDGSGNSIKIKGKSTKSTINLANVTYPILLNGEYAAIEFENIIFVDPNSSQPFFNNTTSTKGFYHFINCDFNVAGHLDLRNTNEGVFDGCSWVNQGAVDCLYVIMWDEGSITAKLIINNCTVDNTNLESFAKIRNFENRNFNLLSITNSDISGASQLIKATGTINNYDIRGNTFDNRAVGLLAGIEWSDIDSDYAAWNSETSYSSLDYVKHIYNLWVAVDSSTNSEPIYGNPNWKPAELYTGVIENNIIKKDGIKAIGHGLFIGFGCYNMSIGNNIVTNYNYNYVIKGVSNTIQYNCAGDGENGFTIYANPQTLIANNTSRGEDGYGLQYGAQNTNGSAVCNTIMRDNIFFTSEVSGGLFSDLSYKDAVPIDFTNTLNQNIYYGNNPSARFKDVIYYLGVGTEWEAFKTACSDVKTQFLNPEFEGSDATIESYYKPINYKYLLLLDNDGQSVGAVDLRK